MTLTRWLCLVSGVLLPAVLHGQVVTGLLVDKADHPVAGAVVFLLDSGGTVVTRALSSERGEFRLASPSAGAFRVRTMRIGFLPQVSDPIPLVTGQSTFKRLALTGAQFSLDTVRVVGRNNCRSVGDSATLMFAVWEQARVALTATQLGAAQRAFTATTLTYRRTLDRNSQRVRQQSMAFAKGIVTAPWRAISADSLRTQGYVASLDDSVSYYAPDVDILTSPQFAEDHCFHLSTASTSSSLGISFEPAPGRTRVADIRGTMWIDRPTSELRRLEFQYANVPPEQASRAGGTMAFVRMRNGGWVISRWNIQMPVVARRRSANPMVTSLETYVAEVAVDGGEVIAVTVRDDTLWTRPPLVLAGTVVDSVTGAPIPNARLALVGTNASGVTSAVGRFEISGVLPGEYEAELHTPGMDAFGVTVRRALSFSDSTAGAVLTIPSLESMTEGMCGANIGTGKGVVVGTVRVRGDESVPKPTRVFATWTLNSTNFDPGASNAASSRRQVRGLTDAAGMYRLCGVPRQTLIDVQAEAEDASTEPVQVRITDGGFVRADLLVDVLREQGATFAGTVLVDTAEVPVAGADITIPLLALSTRSDERGSFRLRGIPAGTHAVSVRRVGYLPLETKLTFGARERMELRVRLHRVTLLDSMRITAQASVNRTFDDHFRTGLGTFFTRADLAKVEGQSIGNVLRQVRGVKVLLGTGNRTWIAASRQPGATDMQTSGLDDADVVAKAKPACYANVFLDGLQVYGAHSRQSKEPLFDINSLAPSRLEAIEYYAGAASTPMEYSNLNSTCGTLVLWSRRTFDTP